MEQIINNDTISERAKQILSMVLTVLAALLYAAILGHAVVRTYFEGQPQFTEGTIRAAGLLSGLVGAVVTAGFARSSRPASVSIAAAHPLGGYAATGWSTLRPPSFVRSRFLGLAYALGFRVWRARSKEVPTTPVEEQPSETNKLSAAVWIAVLYFVIYFVIGACAFLLTILRQAVPDLISSSSWVWLGTVLSSGYSFFALGSES